MVISVFPDVSQGFARYEQSRRGRLQDQALRTQNNMMQRRQAAFQDMVAGLEGQEQQIAEVMGPDYVTYAAQRDAARQAAEQEAAAAAQEAAAAARERQLELVTDAAERFPVWQQQNPDADPMDYWSRQATIAESAGVPVQRDENGAPVNFANLGMSLAMGRAAPNADRTQLERTVNALVERGRITQERADEILLSFAEVDAGLRARPSSGAGPYEGLADVFTASQLGSLYRDQYDTANARISANRELLGLLDDFEAQTELTGEGYGGLLAYLRESGQGVLSQLDQIAQFGTAGQQIAGLASQAQDPRNWAEGSNPAQFFNPELAGLSFLKNTLAYAVARANDPGARLSDADVRQARNSLGFGPTSSDEQIQSVFRTIRRRAERSVEFGIQDRRAALGGELNPERPEQPERAPARPDYIPEDTWNELTEDERRDPAILEAARRLSQGQQ